MRCRTDYRATCSSVYVIWALQFTSIFFGHRSYIFYVDTCCVWGGFGRFRPASTWRHNPVPFISQVPGGVLRRANPPFYSCLCFVLFRLHHNRQRLTQNQWNLFLFVINSLRAVGRPQKVLICGERTVLSSFYENTCALSL